MAEANQPHPPSTPAPCPPAHAVDAATRLPPVAPALPSGPATIPVAPVNALTPEEQMALFAKDLQENDWGHQPC